MMSLFSRVRFLPLTIFAATLLLTVKVTDIWEGFEGLTGNTLEIARAAAQVNQTQQAPQPLTPPANQTGQITTGNNGGGAGNGANTAQSTAQDGQSGGLIDPMKVDPFAFSESKIEAKAERIATQDPTLMSEQEIALLQQLSDRRREIEKREKDIDQRVGLMSAAETRIDNKILQLKTLQQTISGLIVKYNKQQEKKIQSLVKIYENMKPKDAARIFENLEMDTLLSVAEQMKERKLAAILANMNAKRAQDITVELAKQRELPQSGTAGG